MVGANGSLRDLRGYGRTPPDAQWPGGAKLAVSIVLNYEEGAELSVANGDASSEAYMHEMPGSSPVLGMRHRSAESMYEYGTRAGLWRAVRIVQQHGVPVTVFACGLALELYPEAGAAFAEFGYEVAGHGYRWINYQYVSEAVEREHIARTVEAIRQTTGRAPVGWFTGRSSPNTRRLVVESGGFIYDSESLDDDLPYWVMVDATPHLVVPYSFDTNDMKYASSPGFVTAADFAVYLCDAFDVLYAESETSPKMMSVGLHCRMIGHPGRAKALEQFLAHVARFDDVWVCRREEIARHWMAVHPYQALGTISLPRTRSAH
ncbi:MAG TPA: allantoinase PuuE [Candidatus Dormibacteraeota bacterium]|jgi:putative urate catabolism protein|nr:allantoinase PuuE [Candidatus Dormibacteraeota bacterium]